MSKNLEILKDFNILYLEDDESLLKHTKDALEDFVANIYGVKTTVEAMKILLEKRVDVIISDIQLENENGINFLKYIKSKNINIPSILTTAHTDTNYLIEAIKLKVENYLIKPINIDELLNSLYDVILPKIQEKEIKKNSNIIKTIGAITDSKQVEIIKYIFNNLDEKQQFYASYSEIMDKFSISKPTLIKLFKDLADKNILIKIAHKTYQFDEKSLNDWQSKNVDSALADDFISPSAWTIASLGFIVTAILALFFLALGALVLHGSAYEFKDGIAFSHQLITMYSTVIGDWTIFISIIGFLIIIYFASYMRTMLDFAMILSFTTTPIFAF